MSVACFGSMIGGYIVLEAVLSVALSQDQRWMSTVGRISRILLGGMFIIGSITKV